uniref:Elicitin n=1 Tax=Hyaloperonospora arabidopsidis (strain Emoy2) TaxID=559515 RepID=M4BE21_HYAAE
MNIALGSALLLVVAAFSSIAAAPCNTVALSKLFVTGNVTLCRADPGYDPTSMALPTDAQITAVCNSDACKKSISAIKEVAPEECTVGPIRMYADVLNPLSERCGLSSGSRPDAGSVAGNTSYPANTNTTGSAANISQPNARSNSSSPSPNAAASNEGADALTIPMFAAIAVLVAMVTLLL